MGDDRARLVSPLTVLARRGDSRDRVVVTDGEGVPQRDVTVQRFVDGRPGDTARTDERGAVEMVAVDAHDARYVAVRGDAVAWADVRHLRAEVLTCGSTWALGGPSSGPARP